MEIDDQHARQDGQSCTQPEGRPRRKPQHSAGRIASARYTHGKRRRLGIRGGRSGRSRRSACKVLAAASDLRENRASLGLGVGIEFRAQRIGERTIELHRGAPPAALAIEPHQAADGGLMQRFKFQNPHARLDRALAFAALDQLRHQPGKNIDGLIAVARRLRPAPGFELFALDVEPI